MASGKRVPGGPLGTRMIRHTCYVLMLSTNKLWEWRAEDCDKVTA